MFLRINKNYLFISHTFNYLKKETHLRNFLLKTDAFFVSLKVYINHYFILNDHELNALFWGGLGD